MVPFCKPLGLTSPSVSRAPEGLGGCTPRLCQRGPQTVAGFSCKCLSSLSVAAQCREWLMEQCKWRKDTKGGEGGTEGHCEKPRELANSLAKMTELNLTHTRFAGKDALLSVFRCKLAARRFQITISLCVLQKESCTPALNCVDTAFCTTACSPALRNGG